MTGLNKRRVRALAAHLGAPAALAAKVPTADLETFAPLRPDENAYGAAYDQIDDLLERKTIDQDAVTRILEAYNRTAHKRALPQSPCIDAETGGWISAVWRPDDRRRGGCRPRHPPTSLPFRLLALVRRIGG